MEVYHLIFLYSPFLITLFTPFTSSTSCTDAQLPFFNTKSSVDPPDPFFSCFTCVPDNLTPAFANRPCSDGNDPELNITVDCDITCQNQIDTFLGACDQEGDPNIFDFSGLTGSFFNKWGKCDFGYEPTQCDQELVDFTATLTANSIACARNFIPNPPTQCEGVCTDAIQRLIQECSGSQFLVRTVGSELPNSYEKGSIQIFNESAPQIDDIVWTKLSDVCLDVARELVGTATSGPGSGGGTDSPTPSGDEDTGKDKGLDLGTSTGKGIVGGIAAAAVLLGVSAVFFFKGKTGANGSKKKDIPEADAVDTKAVL